MASSILRSRISSLIFSRTKRIRDRRGFSTADVSSSSNPSKESIISESSAAAAAAAASLEIPPPPPPSEAASAAQTAFNFFKYGVIASLTGATAFAGYATYAYTLDEVEKRTEGLRESVNVTPPDDAPALEKYKGLLYSAAMTVPLKATELYLDMRRMIEEQVKGFTEPISDKLLPDLHPQEQHVFTLVLDLNETIIYSDWKRERGWRTFKRPGVEAFLQHLAQFYEIIVYSDQLNMYVDPVVDRLDQNHCIRYRLSRGATKYQDNKHYRDLSKLNRDPAKILYVSANAYESCLQPENCVPIKPFKLDDKGDAPDTTLLDLIPFLEYVARNSPPDIRQVLASYKKEDIAKEFLERSKEHQRRMQEQRQQGRFWRR